MAVTLYSTYIDYNGNRTFVSVSNCQGEIANIGLDFQCQVSNCAVLGDSGETVSLSGTGFTQYNCNCNCVCACNC
jgi:hypothetical protein